MVLCSIAARLPFLSDRRRRRFARSAEKRHLRILVSSGKLGAVGKGSASPRTRLKGLDEKIRVKTAPAPAPGAASHRILVVSALPPTTHHAGGLRILDMLKQIKSLRPDAYVEIFTRADHAEYGALDEADATADRVTLTASGELGLQAYLDASPHGGGFDVVDFQFLQPASVLMPYRWIGKKLVFTPMESHIRNEAMLRGGVSSVETLESDEALEEAAVCLGVDLTVCVSELDRATIAECTGADVMAIETGVSEIEFGGIVTPADPSDAAVCYVAYFGSETNRVALRWYLANVHPRVLSKVPNYEFRIVGRGDVADILPHDLHGIRHVGEVGHIAPHIAASAVGIAPAFSGAGFRGKINQYAALGVPCVATTIAADGLAYVNEVSIRVAEEAEDFANKITGLLLDEAKRLEMGQAARNVCRESYMWQSRTADIARAYDL